MESFKQFIVKHFEKVLIIIILIAAVIGTYLIEEKSIVLNFYYLPVRFGGLLLGASDGCSHRHLLYCGRGDLYSALS